MTKELTIIDRDGKSAVISGDQSQSVMEVIKAGGLPVQAICGGHGICSTCHIYIAEPYFSAFAAPDEDEIELLHDTKLYDPARSRLSCQLSMSQIPQGFTATLAPE